MTLQQFGAELDARLAAGEHDVVLADLIPLFDRLIASGAIGRAIDIELQKLNADSCYLGRWHHRQLPLLNGNKWMLTLAVLERTPQFIHSNPRPQLRALLNDAEVEHQRFELPADYQNASFAAGLQLTPRRRQRLPRQQCIAMEPGRFIDDFVIDRAAVFLQLSLPCLETVEWLFSREHLSAERANDADIEATQQRVAAYVLGRLGDHRALPGLQQLRAHPNHSVRWAAIEALARLDQDQALDALRAASHDPHPHIRSAALASLQRGSKESGDTTERPADD